MFLCAKCALCQMFRSARACAAEMHMNMSKEFAHGNLQKKCRTQIRRPPFCASLRNNHFLWKFTGEMSNPADTTSIEHRALESFQSGSEWFPDWFLTGFHFAPPPFSLARCKLACCMPTVLTLTSPMMIMRSRVRKCLPGVVLWSMRNVRVVKWCLGWNFEVILLSFVCHSLRRGLFGTDCVIRDQ